MIKTLKERKISFLMAAHNEEKIIAKALNNLLNLPYEDYEVIIGLDGCTDHTEEIVSWFCKKSKKFRYFNLNLREGKPAVINSIIKYSEGDIIIIHDADWIFRVKNKKDLDKIISFFDNPKVGGIADPFPLHFIPELIEKKSIIEKGVMWSTYVWMDYVKNNYTKRIKNSLLLLDKEKMKFPLLVNIFRKNLYKPNISLGDDFERCIDILNEGYDVVVLEKESFPRMISYGEKITIKGLLKQKERTALAREQIRKKYRKDYSLDSGFYFYLLKFMGKMKFKDLTSLVFYIFLFSIGSVKNIFMKKKSTKEGWKMRQQR